MTFAESSDSKNILSEADNPLLRTEFSECCTYYGGHQIDIYIGDWQFRIN